MQIISSERLTLRLFNIDDAEFVYELLNDPSWIKNIGDRGITSLEKAKEWITNGPLLSQSQKGFSFYAVTVKDSGITIGTCGLIKRDVLDHVDIGYAFLPRYGGEGYAFEAARATMDYAHNVLNLPKLAAITAPENIKSNKLLLKLGFTFEDVVVLNLSGKDKRNNRYGYAFPRSKE